MAIDFVHREHPRIAFRRTVGPPKAADEHVGFNGRVGLVITTAVGTMWCAYAFALLALVALPDALNSGSLLPIVQWLSQTFIQLVMLSVIMVGQNVQSRASDKRAEMTYEDADAILHEAIQIQEHLAAQDRAFEALAAKVAALDGNRADPGPAAER